MRQSRAQSLAEAVSSVALGYLAAAVVLAWVVAPRYGWAVSTADNLEITAIFTAVSLVKSYLVRRWWEWRGRNSGAWMS